MKAKNEGKKKRRRAKRREGRELRPDGNLHLQQYSHTLIAAYIVDNCTHKIMVTPSLIPVSCGKSLGTRLSHI